MQNAIRPLSLEIVVPIYNEAESLPDLLVELDAVFSPRAVQMSSLRSVCFIFVDDGSRDRSATIISEYISRGGRATLLRLSRNFGHQNAVTAGLDICKADLIAVIDADLQDPPELILEMIAKVREGYDVVYGQRQKRKENIFKKFCYWSFYRLLGALSEVEIPLDAGDFCVITRRVLDQIKALPERLRFVRGLRSWVGFRQTGIIYDRPGRNAGDAKYTWARLYALATDGLASSTIRPLRITQAICVGFLFLSMLLIIVTLIRFKLSFLNGGVAAYFLLAYVLVSFGFSMIAFCLYVLSAYIGRMYLEIKGRPPYIVMETITPSDDEGRASL